MKKTRKYLLCLQVTCSKLLQLSKSWSNFISDRRIIWRLLSTHYLTQRQTEHDIDNLNDRRISTHYLTQRQTFKCFSVFDPNLISTHYLTQRQTGLIFLSAYILAISTHYLTQRQTRKNMRTISIINYFNSLPHAEVDGSAWDIHSLCHISTHYLTQRQTRSFKCCSNVGNISTHYLTQRQTLNMMSFLPVHQNFNSLPHAEVDSQIPRIVL